MLRAIVLAMAAAAAVGACGSGTEAAGPTVRSVEPATASARGGAVVTIAGEGLSGAKAVRFGDVAGEIVQASAGSIEVRVPRTIAGTVDVVVDVAGATASLDDGFTFAPLPIRFFDVAPTRVAPSAVDGRQVVMADLDGDGDLDVAQAAGREGARLYDNDGTGTFATATMVAEPEKGAEQPDFRAIVVTDLDGDGAADLFLAASDLNASRLFLQGTSGAWLDHTGDGLPGDLGPVRAALPHDVDGDGDTDLLLATPGAVVLLANDGKGGFADVSDAVLPARGFDAAGMAVGDLDGNGALDVLFSVAGGAPRLYVGDGAGHFALAPPDAIPADLVAGAATPALLDLDGDGSLDVYVPAAGQDRAYLNDGSGRFFDRTSMLLGPESDAGEVAVTADLDLDGHADLVVANRGGLLRALRNDGTGRMFDYSLTLAGNAAARWASGVALGDVDADGDLDIFAGRDDLAAPSLYLAWDPVPLDDDADDDGIPSDVDDCPLVPDPEQANRDSGPFGCTSRAACLAATGCDLAARGETAYLVCRTAPLPWDAAAAYCRDRGGALGLGSDADENDYLVSLGTDGLWVGTSDAAVEGTFVSSEGDALGYAPWADGEPNDGGGAEDCAILAADGKWIDVGCGDARAFFCEDARGKAPDPGDACDDCPDRNRPGASPNDGEGGASCDGAGGGP